MDCETDKRPASNSHSKMPFPLSKWIPYFQIGAAIIEIVGATFFPITVYLRGAPSRILWSQISSFSAKTVQYFGLGTRNLPICYGIRTMDPSGTLFDANYHSKGTGHSGYTPKGPAFRYNIIMMSISLTVRHVLLASVPGGEHMIRIISIQFSYFM